MNKDKIADRFHFHPKWSWIGQTSVGILEGGNFKESSRCTIKNIYVSQLNHLKYTCTL